MEKIQFNNIRSRVKISYSVKPVIDILRIRFQTDHKDWISRIFSKIFIIKISAVDKDNEISSIEMPLSIGAYITPDHKQPIIEINQFFKFSDSSFHNLSNWKKWEAEIILKDLKFEENEVLTVEYMDSNYINKRVDDWQGRVDEFIEQIKRWSHEEEGLEVKESRMQRMHEGMMKSFEIPMREIKTADLLKDGKLILAIKPFGLWILGANGRIDLLTKKGNHVLVDTAENFQIPCWKIYLKNDKKQGIQFDKKVFSQLIEA